MKTPITPLFEKLLSFRHYLEIHFFVNLQWLTQFKKRDIDIKSEERNIKHTKPHHYKMIYNIKLAL